MSTPNRQIGWSNESNLLWQISKEIDRLTTITGSGISNIISILGTKVTNQLGVPSMRADILANLPVPGETGRMFVSTDTYAFYRDNGAGWDLIGGPGIGTLTGSGTTNYISKFTGSSALGNSLIFDNGTSVGIGTNTPSSSVLLDIVGSAKFSNTTGSSPVVEVIGSLSNGITILRLQNTSATGGTGIRFMNESGSIKSQIFHGNTSYSLGGDRTYVDALGAGGLELTSRNGNLDLNTSSIGASNTKLRIFNNGNVAIGTNPSDAGYKLDVNGTARVQTSAYFATSSGSVGIGTTSPASTLEVYKSSGANYIYLTNGASGTNNGVVLRYNSVDYMGMIGNFNSGELKVGGFNASGYFLTFYSNNSERARFFTSGNFAIGTTTDISSAILNVSSTTQGFLPPRMTNAQMTAIATPASGLVVYDTTNNKLNVYNGTNWVAVH